MLGYVLGAAAIAGILWLANGVRRIGAISRGEPIQARAGKALLLVDLQTVFWDEGPYSEEQKAAAMAVILDEVSAAKAHGDPIVAVRQEWSIPSTKAIARLTMKGQAIEGTAGTELAKPFANAADHIFVKRIQDAFETGELDALFERLGVGELRIVGLDLNYCVLKTALAARNRGYRVTVLKQGTLSAAHSKQAEERLVSRGVVCE